MPGVVLCPPCLQVVLPVDIGSKWGATPSCMKGAPHDDMHVAHTHALNAQLLAPPGQRSWFRRLLEKFGVDPCCLLAEDHAVEGKGVSIAHSTLGEDLHIPNGLVTCS